MVMLLSTVRARSSNTLSLLVSRTMSTSSSVPETYLSWRVDKVEPADGSGKAKFVGTEQTLATSETFPSPSDENVFIKVTHSSLNYKDALSAAGNKGVTRNFPHTPGIDASGIRYDTGQPCVVTGYDLGMNTDGGFGTLICVPKAWIVDPNPFLSDNDSIETASKTAMMYGKFTLVPAARSAFCFWNVMSISLRPFQPFCMCV